MTTLRPLAALGTAQRGAPCLEYPGEWLTYLDGNQEQSHSSFAAAYLAAEEIWNQADQSDPDFKGVSICWKCSDNDPRQGESWFTGFYQDGHFNIWGQYVK